MSYVVPGTSNTLFSGLGGSSVNSGPINFGAISASPKTTALNNAKSGPSFSIPGVGQSFSVPNSVTGLMNSTAGGVSTPTIKPQGFTTIGQDIGNLSKNLGITPGYGVGGVPLNPNSPPQQSAPTPQISTGANFNFPQGNTPAQPTFSSSGGAIIPQGGAAGTPVQNYQPPAQQQNNQAIGTPQGPNANPPAWYTQALQQQNQSTSTPSSTSAPPPPQTTATPNTSNLPANNPATYAQSLAANAMQGSPIAGVAANGLISSTNSPLVQGLLSDYQKKAAEAQQFQQNLQQGEQNLTQQAVPLNDVEGEQAAMQRNYGIQEQALAQQAANALNAVQQGISEQGTQQTGFNEAGNLGLTGQGLLQSGLTSASQLTQPSSLFTQVSPGNYLADSSGQGVAGGMAQGLANLTSLGQAQQNISGGQALQGQAQQLAPVLQQLQGTGSQVSGLLQQSGLNPSTVPIANQLASPYFKQQNPAAAASVQKGLADISSYIGQILSTNSGLTPTEVTSLTDTNALESLSPQQLQVLLSNVDQLGQTRLQALQQGSQANYGANLNGSGAYTGPTAAPGALSNSGATNNPVVSGAATAGAGVVGVLSSFAKQLGSFVSENAALGIGAALFGG